MIVEGEMSHGFLSAGWRPMEAASVPSHQKAGEDRCPSLETVRWRELILLYPPSVLLRLGEDFKIA